MTVLKIARDLGTELLADVGSGHWRELYIFSIMTVLKDGETLPCCDVGCGTIEIMFVSTLSWLY